MPVTYVVLKKEQKSLKCVPGRMRRHSQTAIQIIILSVITVVTTFAFENGLLTATEIMKRVAENQDREQKARTQFVYEETVHRAMRRKDGKLLREEYRTFAVTPGAKGTERKQQSVKGRYWKKGKYITFEGEPVPEGGLLDAILDDGDRQTKDGIDKDLFPLTSDEQKNYVFELAGDRLVKERPVYKIQFRPAHSNDYGWAGEALIDKEEF